MTFSPSKEPIMEAISGSKAKGASPANLDRQSRIRSAAETKKGLSSSFESDKSFTTFIRRKMSRYPLGSIKRMLFKRKGLIAPPFLSLFFLIHSRNEVGRP